MTLEDFQKEWFGDLKYDQDNLDVVSLNIEKIIYKYVSYFATEAKAWKLLLERKKVLYDQLEDYYLGKLDGKDIGREPYQKHETKESSKQRIPADRDMVELSLKIIDAETKVEFLKEIIYAVKQRSFNVGHAIDFRKFMGGL
jgi:hypothetical protein